VSTVSIEEKGGVNFTKIGSLCDPNPSNFLKGYFYTLENVTMGSVHSVVVVDGFIVWMD